jgi:small subunit ribosomal protein S9
MAVRYFEGIGRRKKSTARVRIMSGSGQFLVNGKPLEAFFPREGDKENIFKVFRAINQQPEQYDVSVVVSGGGITGQTDAVLLGLARAFVVMNPDLRSPLRKAGVLTRDPRVKERKKPGLKRARKAPTYTKR